MSINNYTPIQLPKKNSGISGILHSHIEPMLLSMLVLTGIIGSIYLFGHPIVDSSKISSSQAPNGASISSILFAEPAEESSNQFDEYISIKEKPESNKDFHFDFIKDEKSARYVLEMGDGVRLIVTQKNLFYTYKLPGKYTIELKEVSKGILQLIGTKKIKVK